MPLPPLSRTACPSPASPLPMERLLLRSRSLRCLLIACLSVVAGGMLLPLLLPSLPDEQVSALLLAHLPAEHSTPLTFWLRLCAARLPFWFLLSLAGFTRFSGGLTSAVTLYRGLCDGAVLGLLSALATGRLPLSLPEGFTGIGLWQAFGLWAAADLLIRLGMTLSARRVAGMEWAPCGEDGLMAPAVRSQLLRYLAVCLGGLAATLAACGMYAQLLT